MPKAKPGVRVNKYTLAKEAMPREKLMLDPSGRTLSDAELLAIVLNTGVAGHSVFELAMRLLAVFPSQSEFVDADWRAMSERLAEWNETHPIRKRSTSTRFPLTPNCTPFARQLKSRRGR